MVDMSQFIAAKSDQLNADDLMGAPRTITVTKVTAQPDAAEQPVSIHYEGGEGRPWKPCKTMRRILIGLWGKDASKYAGRSLTLFRDDKVSFGGMQVGGIRISHASHIESEKIIHVGVTRGRKAPYKVEPLKDAPAAQQSAADPAETWTNGFIAKLDGFIDEGAIDTFADEKSEKLKELAAKRPELYTKIQTAIATRKAEIAPQDDAGGTTLGEQMGLDA